MTKSHTVLAFPLLLSIIGIAFCIWSGLGNDVNFCVTAGCTLYEDFGIAGISLWWFGTGAFIALALCALLGLKTLGRRFAALCVFGDIWFLALLAFTAPCISCLCAGILFVVTYLLFRKEGAQPQRAGEMQPRNISILVWAWALFFVINLGLVARSEADIWPILDASGNPATRMFFSPECVYCRDGVNVLSGNVETAFYPIAENERDVYRIARMITLLNDGQSIAEALAQSADFQEPKGLAGYSPDLVLLRFRLLRNKAHIFAAGSQRVPFFEQKGLPPEILAKAQTAKKMDAQTSESSAQNGQSLSHELPAELTNSGQCGGEEPCGPEQNS